MSEGQKRHVHLEYNGEHFYCVTPPPNSYTMRVRHLDAALTEGQQGWLISAVAVDIERFVYSHMEVLKRTYKLKEAFPSWLALDTSALPKTLETKEEVFAACIAVGFSIDRENLGVHSIEPFAPYEASTETGEVINPVGGEWIHAIGKPRPSVWFSWSAEFPDVIKQHQSIHHLFPCYVIWDEATTKNAAKKLAQGVGFDGQDQIFDYKRGELTYSVHRLDGKVHEHRAIDIPRFKAESLTDLLGKMDSWVETVREQIRAVKDSAVNPCPMCNGTGHAKVSNRVDVVNAKQEALRMANWLKTKRNEASISELRRAIERLADAVLEVSK